jgi:hypothetical protein
VRFVERPSDIRFGDPHGLGWAPAEIAIQNGRFGLAEINHMLPYNVYERQAFLEDPTDVAAHHVLTERPSGMQ